MPDKRGRDFDDFWAEYLHDHSNSHNRTLHVIGTLSAIVVVAFAVAAPDAAAAVAGPTRGLRSGLGGTLLRRAQSANGDASTALVAAG
ncbi:MAG: DUF962 domain-containing protein [Minicystis sp.]